MLTCQWRCYIAGHSLWYRLFPAQWSISPLMSQNSLVPAQCRSLKIKQGKVSVLVKWGDPRNLTGGALLFWDLLTVGCVGDAALGVWHCLTLLPAAHGTDVVVDSLALLLVDGGALLLIHCLTGRSCLAGSSIARLCWSRSSLTRSSVARRGSRGGSMGGMVTTSETSETNPIRTSLGSVLDRAPPTLLSQAESQYGGAQ